MRTAGRSTGGFGRSLMARAENIVPKASKSGKLKLWKPCFETVFRNIVVKDLFYLQAA